MRFTSLSYFLDVVLYLLVDNSILQVTLVLVFDVQQIVVSLLTVVHLVYLLEFQLHFFDLIQNLVFEYCWNQLLFGIKLPIDSSAWFLLLPATAKLLFLLVRVISLLVGIHWLISKFAVNSQHRVRLKVIVIIVRSVD